MSLSVLFNQPQATGASAALGGALPRLGGAAAAEPVAAAAVSGALPRLAGSAVAGPLQQAALGGQLPRLSGAALALVGALAPARSPTFARVRAPSTRAAVTGGGRTLARVLT